MKSSDKIARMYSLFGVASGEVCRDCMHFERYARSQSRTIAKCKVYGVSSSEATDWNGRNEACGCFNKATEYRQLYKTWIAPKAEVVLEGQMSLDEFALSGN